MSLYAGAPGFDRFIPYAAVKNAHVLYRAGMSALEVAELLYERYGYSSARTCETTLLKVWRQHGFAIRSNSEAQRLRSTKSGCAGCGCSKDERTQGCHPCNRRHYERKQDGLPFTPTPGHDHCRRCGCAPQERTFACPGCAARHASWKRKGLPHIPGTGTTHCAGCGCVFTERTPGCRTCYSRHYARSKRGLVSPSLAAANGSSSSCEATSLHKPSARQLRQEATARTDRKKVAA